jgi:hypothetical protein
MDKGQKFEADAAYIDIYQQAEKSIYVIDDYVNVETSMIHPVIDKLLLAPDKKI